MKENRPEGQRTRRRRELEEEIFKFNPCYKHPNKGSMVRVKGKAPMGRNLFFANFIGDIAGDANLILVAGDELAPVEDGALV